MFLEPTQLQGMHFVRNAPDGPITMLNLLQFRDVADYTAHPDLAPPEPISGREAYERYSRHTLPILEAEGGSVTFLGSAGHLLIGPSDVRWDMVMLVTHASAATFLAMASNAAYLEGIGHRTAALADSRLLPIQATNQ
ncbi:MAG: DUF1330 domain-containing protein [Acidimicrobiia bacterium]